MNLIDVKDAFLKMPGAFHKHAADGIDAVFQFDITGNEGGNWSVIVKDQTCEVQDGSHPNPTVILIMSSETWLAILNKEMNPVQAFMGGKLRVKGDMLLARRVPELFSL